MAAALPVRSCGGKQMASAQLGSHHDVAVLHAGVELDLAARAPAEGGVARR